MIMLRWFSAILLSGAILVCCETNPSDDGSQQTETVDLAITFFFKYKTEASPVAVAEGHLTLPVSFKQDSEFEGTWRLQITSHAKVDDSIGDGFITSLTGSGDLRGDPREKGYYLNLSPHAMDDNIVIYTLGEPLLGECTWAYRTYNGVSATGEVRISIDDG